MAVPDSYWGSYTHGHRQASKETNKLKEENKRLAAEIEKLKKENETLKKALEEAERKK